MVQWSGRTPLPFNEMLQLGADPIVVSPKWEMGIQTEAEKLLKKF